MRFPCRGPSNLRCRASIAARPRRRSQTLIDSVVAARGQRLAVVEDRQAPARCRRDRGAWPALGLVATRLTRTRVRLSADTSQPRSPGRPPVYRVLPSGANARPEMPSPADASGRSESRGESARGHVPERYGRIAVGGRGERLAVGSECQGRDRHARPAERRHARSRLPRPRAGRSDRPRSGQRLAVGGERDAADRPGVAFQGGAEARRGHVPERSRRRRRLPVAIVVPSGETAIDRATLRRRL